MLNWLARYAPAGADLLDADARLPGSLLDVGCGPHGFACAHPDVPFVGLDVDFPTVVAASMVAVQASPGRLPFGAASFDTVLSLDTLEHIPPADRAPFVAELGRVAARRVLIACPSRDAAALDALVRRRYEAARMPVPAWLAEHDEHGLPEVAEIAACCTAVDGFTARPWPMVNGLLASLLSLGDLFELAAEASDESVVNRDEWVRLLAAARFGASFRVGWELLRDDARTPRIGLADLLGDTAAALECRSCGSGHAVATGGDLRCGGCGALAPRTAQGAYALRDPEAVVTPAPAAPRPAPAPAPAVRPAPQPRRGAPAPQLVLRPDWERPATWLPALAAFVRGADPASGAALYLDSATSDLGLPFVAQVLEHACARLAQDAPFAEVVVLAESEPPPAGAALVGAAEEVHGALRSAPAPASLDAADPSAVVARARWGKLLHDETRAIGERARHATAGAREEIEPLVSVRIPTWNGIEKLLGTSLPSVLHGSYGNVEVVVCSDGPDDDCRAAVERIGDPRVRFLQLAQRPRYASHYWSFWETAGICAVNRALDDARGAWIAPLDHDDAFTDDHVAVLLGAAREHGLDMVYGQALFEDAGRPPRIVGSAPLRHGQIAHGSVLYGPRLRHFRMDPHSWLLEEPGDWNMWRRMSECGARIANVARVVVAHGRERTSIEDDERLGEAELAGRVARTDADHAQDVLQTDARLYLEIAPIAEAATPPARPPAHPDPAR